MATRRLSKLRIFCIGLGLVILVYLAKTKLIFSNVSESSQWKPRKVLLFSNARSGSSLTGDIIYHSPDVYYVFEPLSELSKNKTMDTDRKGNELLHSLLTCDLFAPLVSNMTERFLKRTQETALILKCSEFKPHSSAHQRCMKIAQSVCRSFPVTMVKVIRYNMTFAEQLLTLNPDLALIFLVRDPRASTWSRMNVFKYPHMAELGNFSMTYCQRLQGDVLKAQTMLKTFPDRMRFLRYEDLADNPVKVSRHIYSFLQLNYTNSVQQDILSQTAGSLNKSHTPEAARTVPKNVHAKDAYTLSRPDSSQAASEWRSKVPWDVIDVIQKSCADVLSVLGYKPFPSKAALKNLALTARRKMGVSERWDLGRAPVR